MSMKLSIVVPVHNENENLRPLIEEIESAVTGLGKHEIVYVDDGSSDDTLSRLGALKASFPALRVLYHIRCCGQSTALRTGIKAANGEVIVTLDGDGQNDPANIPAMLEAWRELKKADQGRGALIAGYRRNRKDTGWRKFSSRFANRIRAALLGDATPDTGCGLKLFDRSLFLELPYFDHMHRFLPAHAQRAGAKVVSLEVNHRPRTLGISKYGTWQRL
ncbi:MAG: glycosyltransferase family 2 protein, partial [Methylococcaceae bacterium]|nr:glycosyltransferase family 2 protein [Methylococcaceae bacterium]